MNQAKGERSRQEAQSKTRQVVNTRKKQEKQPKKAGKLQRGKHNRQSGRKGAKMGRYKYYDLIRELGTADTFNSRQVFVPVCFTVRGKYYSIFSSGTKLYVTASDEPVVKPVVSVYPAASRAHLEGKSSLLCLASDMSPPLVQFSWKRQKQDGPLEELPPAEGEQLELTGSGRAVAIRVVDRDAFYTYKYRCYVRHEGGTVAAQTEQVAVKILRDPGRLPDAGYGRAFNSPCRTGTGSTLPVFWTRFLRVSQMASLAEPDKKFTTLEQRHQPRTLNKQMLQGLRLRAEETLLPQLRIQVRSVSVRSYRPVYNPPLEVCCPLFNGQLVEGQLPFEEAPGPKNSVHLDNLIPAKERRFRTFMQI
ncbi:uncharacterized protein LOC120799865 [Xiphias gladius]|uniref:uncharacterized protein LOC120799865 n=1 Tax=Xiphias gladius TaxID=8245 RepID=UPI001A991CCC|nr:uncharacterized protein LOC120799865 [Xiphias gladius]